MSCGEWNEDEFARRWSDHLRRRFASPAEIVDEFGVSHRTAEYWRAGETTPRGWQLARYLARHPEAVDALFGSS